LADVCAPAVAHNVARKQAYAARPLGHVGFPLPYREQIVLADAQSSGSVFTSCLRLFRRYPLAVRRHYAEHRYGSMVLMNRDTGTDRFVVLIMEWEDLFVIRPWDRRDWARVEITPRRPVPGDIRRLVENSVPVPRDGALLGWLAEQRVTAILAAYGRLPEPWDDPSAVPGVLVMPRADTRPGQWPPFMVGPLDSGRLWQSVERGQLADISGLVARRTGRVFWVPGAERHPGSRADGRIVVTENAGIDGYWLPAGVYADHWALREGTPQPSAGELLALPGVTDLARGRAPELV
jgi:hypothetical protein